MLKLTTDKHEASCGLSATAELLVIITGRPALHKLSPSFVHGRPLLCSSSIGYNVYQPAVPSKRETQDARCTNYDRRRRPH